MEWSEQDEPFPNDEEREYFKDKVVNFLVKKSIYQDDGYQLAKDFESETYCEGDSALVEIFDNAFFGIYDAEKKHTQAWVSRHGIKLAAKEGDKIFYTSKRFGTASKRYEGIVSKCYHEEAKYSICVEELGHKKPGEKGTGTYGTIVNAEDAELS